MHRLSSALTDANEEHALVDGSLQHLEGMRQCKWKIMFLPPGLLCTMQP